MMGWPGMIRNDGRESLRSKTMERSTIFMGKITIFIGKDPTFS
jgi:hypothetical protein